MTGFAEEPTSVENQKSIEVIVGKKLRELRTKSGFSLRTLANLSGLNMNTLSLIENSKSSPSVSTLQQLASALSVPISAFFESEPIEKKVVFTPADNRHEIAFGSSRMQNLGKDFTGNIIQPFLVTIEPSMGSGDRMIVHTGYEFVFCLSGSMRYQLEENEYQMDSGDSLLFEAHIPHCWENVGNSTAEILLILYPSDDREEPGCRHFSPLTMKKEINMKIAIITEDGKNISQHFGRAPFYLVLTIEEGKVVSREMRDKMGHTHFSSQEHAAEPQGEKHGMDASSHNKHISMAEAISDCKALLCGGMGRGAYESMRQLNIQPIVTDLTDIEAATQAFIDGKLIDHTELLH